MGKQGIKQPTKLKIVKGERPDRINHREPQFAESVPECPDYLPAEAKAVWAEVVSELDRHKLISVPDGPALEAYCMNVHIFRKASREVNRRGVMVKGYRNSIVKNPALSVMRDAAEKIRAYAKEFGLTPSARSGLQVGEDKGGDTSQRLLS